MSDKPTNGEVFAMLSKLLDTLREQRVLVEMTPAGYIKINSEKLTKNNTFDFVQRHAIEDPALQRLLLIPATELMTSFKVVISKASRVKVQYDPVTIQNYDYSDLIPFQSITDASKFILFDAKIGKVTDIDFATFKSNPETSKHDVIRGRIEFNPYYPKQLDFRSDQYGRPCNFLNTYLKPAWQYAEDIGVEKGKSYTPPDIFFAFMEHLIPGADCRNFVFDWLHFAITDRCETYLVLNGAKGIGKNLFSEKFCKPFMGEFNHKIAQPSALTSDFNALLLDCRMIVFDEFRVDTPEKINKLKRYVNEDQAIEKKGVDVGATVKTYNSFIISNNDMTDMKLSWDDRRFSVVDLSPKKLSDCWSKPRIDKLLAMFEDIEAIRAIGYWLMYRTPKYTKFDAWKGKHFYALCYSSYSEWQRVIIDLTTSRTYTRLLGQDIKKEYRRRTDSSRMPSVPKVKDFINNYRHDGITPIGKLVGQSNENWHIDLDSEWHPEKGADLINIGIDDGDILGGFDDLQ
jgi:hypothetical protein